MNKQDINKKYILRLFIIITILYAVFSWLLPAVIMHYANNWYAKQGENYEIKVDKLDISIFTGSIDVKGLTFHYTNQSAVIKSVLLNISLLDLIFHKVVIEKAYIEGLELEVKQRKDATELLGLSFIKENASDKNEKIEFGGEELVQSSPAKENPWEFIILEIILKNNNIGFSNEKIQFEVNIFDSSIAGDKQGNDLSVVARTSIQSLDLIEANLHLAKSMNVSMSGKVLNAYKEWKFVGDVSLFDFVLDNPWAPKLGFESLLIRKIGVNSEIINISEIELNHARIDNDFLNIEKYRIDNLNYNIQGKVLTTGVHEFKKLLLTLEFNLDGNLSYLKQNVTQEKYDNLDDINHKKSTNPESLEFIYKIESIKQSEGGESLVRIIDKNLNPKLNLPIAFKEIKISNVTNMQEPMDIKLHSQTDEFNTIMVSANLTQNMNKGNIKFNMKQFDLTSLNGLVAKAIGYHVEKGQLNLSVDMKIKDGEIDGKGKLFIRDSDYTPENQATMDKISKQISMPIDTALMLIKDDNNNIEMDIPLKGNINEPDFSISGLTSKLSRTAFTLAAFHYVQQAIFPYGLMASAAEYIGDKIFSIYLQPITINDNELNDSDIKYMQKIIALMQEKEELQLHVCPQGDHDMTQGSEWQEILTKQAKIIKRYISERESSLSERVILCKPSQGKKTQIILGF